jgi:hypothetical protein
MAKMDWQRFNWHWLLKVGCINSLIILVFSMFSRDGENMSEIEFLGFCKSLKIYPVSSFIYLMSARR